MSLLSSLMSLITGRRGSVRAKRVAWPRPAVEELEPRWVPAVTPAAAVVTNPALVAQSLVLNRVPILAANPPVNLFGSLTGAATILPIVPGSPPPGVSNANPLLLARTAQFSGSGNDFATLFATDSELFRRGMRDFIEGLPGVQQFPPQPPPPPPLRSALPQSLQEPTQVVDDLFQSVRQRPASPDERAEALAFLSRGGSVVELAAILSHSEEGAPARPQPPADDSSGEW
jgi:hypothetical protein